MGIRRRGACLPGFRKLQQKQVVFSVLTGKKQILPLLAPPTKIFYKFPGDPLGKNISGAHVRATIKVRFTFYVYYISTKAYLHSCSALLSRYKWRLNYKKIYRWFCR